MKLDLVIAWVDYVVEWLMYGGKVVKTISNALSTVRDTWPDKPTMPKPSKEATISNSSSVEEVQHSRANDQPVDSSISV